MDTPDSLLSGKPQVHLLQRYSVSALRKRWLRRYSIDIETEMAGVNELAHWRCLESDLEFFTPASTEGSSRLYQQLSELKWYHDTVRWEFEAALPCISNDDCVLEVGTGNGAFLDRLSEQHSGKAIGIELNPLTAQAAIDKGHTILQQPLADGLVKEQGLFDVVCSFQVLEHVSDPLGFAKAMSEMTRPGGLIVIGVPNAQSFIRHWKINLLDMPPHHMTRWYPQTLQYLGSKLGLDVERVVVEPLSDLHSLDYVEAQVQRVLPVPLLPRVMARIFGPLLARHPKRKQIPGHTLLAIYRKPA